MKVKQQRHISAEARAALSKALPYANFDWSMVEKVMAGEDPDTEHGMVWNVGNLCWVLTAINWLGEVEVLLCGGERVRECIPHWEAAITSDPSHKGHPVRADGRKGWARLLPHWERRDDALYLRIA
jgi:hypothetical protein